MSVLSEIGMRMFGRCALLKKGIGESSELQDAASMATSWDGLVRKAEERRRALGSVEGRRALVARAAAALVWGVLESEPLRSATGRLSDARARLVMARAGVLVLEALFEGYGGAVVSASRLSAEMGMDRNDVGNALGWATEVGVLRVVSTHRSGAKRYSLPALPAWDLTACIGRFGHWRGGADGRAEGAGGGGP
jgi:hypothetical protein